MIKEITLKATKELTLEADESLKIPTHNQNTVHFTVDNQTGTAMRFKAYVDEIICTMDDDGQGFTLPAFAVNGIKRLKVFGFTENGETGDYDLIFSPAPLKLIVPKGSYTENGEPVTPTERYELEKEIAVLRTALENCQHKLTAQASVNAKQAEINTAQASVNADLTGFKDIFKDMNILKPGEADPTETSSGTGTSADPFVFDGTEMSYILTAGTYWTYIEDYDFENVQLAAGLSVITVAQRGIFYLPLQGYGTLTYYQFKYDEKTEKFYFETIDFLLDYTDFKISTEESLAIAVDKSTVVQSGDTKPVTSGAVYDAIQTAIGRAITSVLGGSY